MLTGFNTDIKHGDRVFHVQTEDRGLANPVVESLVYVGGEILLSKRSPYRDHVDGEKVNEAAVRQLMDQQHRLIIEAIRRGRFDGMKPGDGPRPAEAPAAPKPPALSPAAAAATAALLAGPDNGPSARTAPAAPRGAAPPLRTPVPARPAAPDRTLDQVIIEYLASEAAVEKIELSVMKGGELLPGESVPLSIRAATALTDRPLSDVHITVRVVSSAAPPQVLVRGVTGSDGLMKVTCTLPDAGSGSSALIVSANSPHGAAEVKHLIGKRRAP